MRFCALAVQRVPSGSATVALVHRRNGDKGVGVIRGRVCGKAVAATAASVCSALWGLWGSPGGGDSHPELGHDARAQMPDGIGAPRGVLQGFGGGTGVARADGAPTPRARGEAGRGGLEFDPNGIIKRRNF